MLDTALAALARRDPEAALAAARDAVAATPESAEAQHVLALALQLAGEPAAALDAVDRALALAPERAGLHLLRATLALASYDLDGAEAALAAAVGYDPNALRGYLLGMHLAMVRGDQAEAERQLKLAQRVAPEHPQTLAAEGQLALASDDAPRAVRLLTAALQRQPGNGVILAGLGLAHLHAGQLAFGEQALRQALAQAPKVLGLRWALIEALRRQGRHAELPAELNALLALRPNDRSALALLGDTLMRAGDTAGGLEAYRRQYTLTPFDPAGLDRLLQLLALHGLREQALELLEDLIARFPDEDGLWAFRVQLEGGRMQESELVLDRWLAARPDSATALGVRAEFEEWRGQPETAAQYAQRALAQAPGTPSAEAVLLRAELATAPQAARARCERLLAQPQAPEFARALHALHGRALDHLDETRPALEAWLRGWAMVSGGMPLPVVAAGPPSTPGPACDGSLPRLAWGPPGSRVRQALLLLASAGLTVMDDRFGSSGRGDGFGPPAPDGQRLDLAGWRDVIAKLGVDPAASVDWLPHWDEPLAAALPGTALLAVIADPRDLLLNWLAFGSPQPIVFPGPNAAADWLAAALAPIASRLEQHDPALVVVRDTELDQPGEDLPARLQQALALPKAPDPQALSLQIDTAAVAFAPGSWRRYADELGPAFDRLAPLAARLGYPSA